MASSYTSISLTSSATNPRPSYCHCSSGLPGSLTGENHQSNHVTPRLKILQNKDPLKNNKGQEEGAGDVYKASLAINGQLLKLGGGSGAGGSLP